VARYDHNSLPPLGDKHRFNATVLAMPRGLLMAYRDGWKGSQLWTVPLDDDGLVDGEPIKLNIQHADAGFGREDPRLFWHKGKPHISFIGVVGNQRRHGKLKHTNQLFARLTADGRAIEDVFSPNDYPPGRKQHVRKRWEKNWQFFDHNNELHAVYSIRPHVVLRVECGTVAEVSNTAWPMPWTGGEPRGGAAPVRIGDEWYCFFHDRVRVDGVTTYRMGVYTFDAAPPFTPRRCTAEPIMWADPSTKPEDQWCACVFPGGAVYRGGDWLIAMGVHDRWTEIHRFDAAWVEERLGGSAKPAGLLGVE
jgi:predicted GH43/DUF377 family glycosyl hydrolase